MKKIVLISMLLLFSQPSFSQSKSNDLIGDYASNFAIQGYGEHRIKLNKDSTFRYEFTWCMLDHMTTGKYKQKENLVYLNYDRYIPDTVKFLNLPEDTLVRPSKFLVKKDKLFIYKSDGSFLTKEVEKYTKQFLFFGKRKTRTKRIYLEKHQNSI